MVHGGFGVMTDGLAWLGQVESGHDRYKWGWSSDSGPGVVPVGLEWSGKYIVGLE